MGRKDHAIRIMQCSRDTDRTENPGRDVLQMSHHESRRGFLRDLASVGAGLTVLQLTGIAEAARNKRARGSAYVGELVAPRIENLRCAFIGVGSRGAGQLERFLEVQGVTVPAIVDPHVPAAEKAAAACEMKGHKKPDLYTGGVHDYKRMLERDDIDAVVISTPWDWHVPQAVDAMKANKHVFCEVPFSYTVDGNWEVVETAEKTQKHCMMLENVCYGREELMFLNMVQKGVIGDLLHGEAAYIHDLRIQMKDIEYGTGSWRTLHESKRNGNLYPTHGLGPVAQYMGIDRGEDRFSFLVSIGSPAKGRAKYARENFPPDHARNKARYICGDINSSLIQTEKGRSILLQYDTTTPRPYTRLNLIQGTKGALAGFPTRVAIEGRANTHEWIEGEKLDPIIQEFEHPLWKEMGERAAKTGGHGGMDFLMFWRLVQNLKNGAAMDQNVYEGASWSVVSALTEASVKKRGRTIDFPDFTRGQWKTTHRAAI